MDTLIAGVILLSTVLAYIGGFTKSVLSLAAYFLSSVVGYYLADPLKPVFLRWISVEKIAETVSFLAATMIAWWVLNIVASQLTKGVKASFLKDVDRTLGAGFGLARGILFVFIFYFAVMLFSPSKSEFYCKESRLYALAGAGAERVTALLPQEWLDMLKMLPTQIAALPRQPQATDEDQTNRPQVLDDADLAGVTPDYTPAAKTKEAVVADKSALMKERKRADNFLNVLDALLQAKNTVQKTEMTEKQENNGDDK